MKLLIRWFLSRQVRQALDVSRQVRRLARAQNDLLPPESHVKVEESVRALRSVLAEGGGKQAIEVSLNKLDKVVSQHLRPYPHARWRENVEVFLVTAAIVLALRTFFFQPMAIPSGSAQPTLWGITQENLKGKPGVEIPTGLRRFAESWWSGVSYFHRVAKQGGELRISEPRTVFPFVKTQVLTVGGESYRLFYSSALEDLATKRAGLYDGQQFRAGEDIINLKVSSGDHLFVNRMVYNFRRPRRGEIVVFHTHDIERRLRPHPGPPLIADTHYIKRLVALGEDRVRIGNDRHLIINGRRLDASTPGFENVYGFDPRQPPRESHYSGHVNEWVARRTSGTILAPLFADEQTEFTVRPEHLLAMGDNTMNSYDGRAWGDFPRDHLVGKAGFVFWPITSRFGWGYR